MILRPDYNLKNIYEINFDEFMQNGIKAVLFDLDSTTMKSKSGVFSEKTLNWFKSFEKDFYIAIVTNNKNKEYTENVKKVCPYKVYDCANKPSPKIIKQVMRGMFIGCKEVAIVGDRPLTDILAGKLAGCKTVLVGSINENENTPTKCVRFLERLTICPF